MDQARLFSRPEGFPVLISAALTRAATLLSQIQIVSVTCVVLHVPMALLEITLALGPGQEAAWLRMLAI